MSSVPTGFDARPYYFDTSALMKLVVLEAESAALRASIGLRPHRASSELAVAELLRAAARYGPRAERRAQFVLRSLALHPMSRSIVNSAAGLAPRTLRTLDAIHLVTALAINSTVPLAAIVTYDQRLIEAAAGYGLPVLSPA